MEAAAPSTPEARPKRATLRLVEPELQLRLPLLVVGVTVAFAVAATLHSWWAYSQLLRSVPSAPDGYLELLGDQTRNFMGISFLFLVAYGFVVVCLCIAYLRRVVGPVVAFRRQVESLRRGNYKARNTLRAGDPFGDLSDDLNDLAQALEVRREMKLLNH